MKPKFRHTNADRMMDTSCAHSEIKKPSSILLVLMVKLQAKKFDLLHYPCSSDLMSSNYYLLISRKMLPYGRRLELNVEYVAETEACFECLVQAFYEEDNEPLDRVHHF